MTIAILLALLAVFAGAVIQGSIGFGFSLTAVPTLALLRPEAVPVTLLCLALPMTSFMALNERRSLNVPAFAWITGGRLPGTVIGIVLLAVVPDNSLARFLGILIIVASLISFTGPSFKATKTAQLSGQGSFGHHEHRCGLGWSSTSPGKPAEFGSWPPLYPGTLILGWDPYVSSGFVDYRQGRGMAALSGLQAAARSATRPVDQPVDSWHDGRTMAQACGPSVRGGRRAVGASVRFCRISAKSHCTESTGRASFQDTLENGFQVARGLADRRGSVADAASA